MAVLLKISYDGTDYCGWQSQKNGCSIQEKLEDAIFKLTGEAVKTVASGRTDAKVHALGQVVSFQLSEEGIRRFAQDDRMTMGTNYYLPDSIRVIDVSITENDFNARFFAKRKTYTYKIYAAKIENPLLKNRALRVNTIDIEDLKEKAKLFVGEHDFKRYNSSGGGAKTTVRTIYDLKVSESNYFDQRIVEIEVTANGFLYNMVRKIVGVLLKRDGEFIKKTLIPPFETAKEIVAGHGLYLKSVEY